MKSFFISALRASAVLGTAFSAKTAEEQEFCNLLDPIIRKDCGIAAAGKDDIVTKAECEALNCCWDTTWYAGSPKSPWCFYPVYFFFGTLDLLLCTDIIKHREIQILMAMMSWCSTLTETDI